MVVVASPLRKRPQTFSGKICFCVGCSPQKAEDTILLQAASSSSILQCCWGWGVMFTSVPDLHCHPRRFGGLLWNVCAHEQEYDGPPGNRGTGRKEQMGPLSFFLAQKMKGRENCFKKWKQLGQRSSGFLGGSALKGEGLAIY